MNLIKKISLMTIFLVFGVNLMAHKPCPVGTCSSYSSLQTEQSLHGDPYMSTIGGMIIGLSGAALLTTTINYCFDRINLSQPQPPIANTPPLLYSALSDNNSAKVVASKMVQRYEENPALVKKLSQNPNNQLSFHGGIPISETWLYSIKREMVLTMEQKKRAKSNYKIFEPKYITAYHNCYTYLKPSAVYSTYAGFGILGAWLGYKFLQ